MSYLTLAAAILLMASCAHGDVQQDNLQANSKYQYKYSVKMNANDDYRPFMNASRMDGCGDQSTCECLPAFNRLADGSYMSTFLMNGNGPKHENGLNFTCHTTVRGWVTGAFV